MQRKTKAKIIAAAGAVLIFVLIICFAIFSNKDSYIPEVYDLDDDAFELAVNPNIEFVMAALNMTESVTDTVLSDSSEEGYVAKIYFVSSFVETYADGDSTQNGGSVEIFKTHDEALKRDEYLQTFSGDATSGQSHAVAGSLVIRTSQMLDAYNQRYLTDRIVHILTSGEVTEKTAQDALKGYLKDKNGTVEISFSLDDVMSLNYIDVKNRFDELGFTNIDYTVSEMNYSSETEFDGDVISVSIDGESEFEAGDSFNCDSPVIIGYVTDKRVAVPMSSSECEGVQYEEIVAAFTSAGFNNVKTAPFETGYNETDTDGSVIAVVINESASFSQGDRFSSEDTVIVNYVVLLPNGSGSTGTQSGYVATTKHQTTTQATTKATTTSSALSDGTMVWIPVNGGSKYHTKSTCSNMKNPQKVAVSQAKAQGYTPCKRCAS